MKNLLIVILSVTFAISSSMAQDPAKMFKSAEKTISKLATQAADNANELTNAIADLHKALESSEVNSSAKNWVNAGKAFNKLANEEFKLKTLNPEYKLAVPNAAKFAYDAFSSAHKLGEKKKMKDIGYGLEDVENHLSNFGTFAYQNKDYAGAFQNFKGSIDAHDLLNEMGKESRLDDPALLADQYFIVAVSGYYSEQFDATKPYLEKLYNDGSTEAFVYDALYNIYADTDTEKALGYLSKGREIVPDDTGLLFNEINHYLKVGELDKLIGKLNSAIKAEPDNVGIYNTLGNVYDQLHQKELKAGNADKAKEYFDSALENYNIVLEKEDTNFDATYSVGALYYNKAATYVDKLNELAADLSPAGMKAYDATKVEMDAIFKQALPYFDKAEAINGDDRNTLIALKEIHARLNDIAKSNKYKELLDKLGVSNN